MEDKKENESLKNVSGKWLDQLLDSLNVLERAEKVMRDGVETFPQYIEMILGRKDSHIILMQIQLKNMGMMISDFEMVFADASHILEKTKLKKMKTKISALKEIYYKGLKESTSSKQKLVHVFKKHGQVMSLELSQMFHIIENELCKLRGDLIQNLNHILFSDKDFSDNSKER